MGNKSVCRNRGREFMAFRENHMAIALATITTTTQRPPMYNSAMQVTLQRKDFVLTGVYIKTFAWSADLS